MRSEVEVFADKSDAKRQMEWREELGVGIDRKDLQVFHFFIENLIGRGEVLLQRKELLRKVLLP